MSIEITNINVHNSIYLDYQATTPMDPRVIAMVTDVMRNEFGNSGSRTHIYGWNAEKIVDTARKNIADLIHADESDIIFTSGATESNNMALKGLYEYHNQDVITKNHIITLVTEHKCVLEVCKYLETKGAEITYLVPDKYGIISIDDIKNAIKENTLCVSIMAVHNEIGVIQDLAAIGKLCKEQGVFFHTDAAQAFGKIPLNVDEMNIDLMSISGHKVYGPKGIGALYRRRKPRVRIKALIHGGGQEMGLRSGTLPVPLIAGLGEAARIASEEMASDTIRIKKLFDKLALAMNKIPDVPLNGHKTKRYFGNANYSFSYVEGESLLMALKGIAVSSGSACTSATLQPSYVLKSLGLSDELAHSSIRFGIGKFTTESDIDYVISITEAAVHKLREISPLWEMVQEGIDLNTVQWVGH